MSENTGPSLTMQELDHMVRERGVCSEGFVPGGASQRPGGLGHPSGGHLLRGTCGLQDAGPHRAPAPASPASSLPTRFS